jgi:DNA-binding PadR family transcriptional regulator
VAFEKRPANPLALVVLGLLLERPMHPHAIATTIRERGLDQSVKVTTGSLYDVVRGLERTGWIEAREPERVGGRPARTVYAHTEPGRDAFVEWLDDLIRVPMKEFPRFATAVAYLGALGPDGARDALEERATRLADEADRGRAVWSQVVGSGRAPRLFLIEAEYALHMLDAELAWVRDILSELAAGTLVWPA